MRQRLSLGNGELECGIGCSFDVSGCELCVSALCVSALCVSALCVSALCVSALCVSALKCVPDFFTCLGNGRCGTCESDADCADLYDCIGGRCQLL